MDKTKELPLMTCFECERDLKPYEEQIYWCWCDPCMAATAMIGQLGEVTIIQDLCEACASAHAALQELQGHRHYSGVSGWSKIHEPTNI